MAKQGRVTLTQMRSRGTDELGRPYYRIRAPNPDRPGMRVTVASGRWTPQEATERLAVVEAQATLGQQLGLDSSTRWTVSDAVVAYLEAQAERHGAETPYLNAETRRLAHVLVHLGDLIAERLTATRLEQYAGVRRREPTQHGGPTAKKSIREEVLSLRRALKLCHELGHLPKGPPPMPQLKGIPDDGRPDRRLTEAEVARLVAAADKLDVPSTWLPREGTKSRELYDFVLANPGLSAPDIQSAHPHIRPVGEFMRPLQRRGCLLKVGQRATARWHAQPRPVGPDTYGLATLATTMAWSGRRPVAVFSVRKRDCERLLNEVLPRASRLMYWSRDKGGVGRGWGPVAEPAYLALRARALEVVEPDALLWPTPTGLLRDAKGFSKVFHGIAELAQVDDAQPYDLRRFACTQLLKVARGQTPLVRAYTGHRSDRALMRYLYAEQGAAEALAEFTGWSSRQGPRLVEDA